VNFSDTISVAGCLLGVIGIVLAIVFYIRGKRTKKLIFDVQVFGLLSDTTASLKDFAATYQEQPLSRLTAAKILLWNSGTDVIDRKDVAETEPIRISVPKGFEILEAVVSICPEPTNNVSVEHIANGNEAIIRFDYIGCREGCIVSLLHTGSEYDMPTVVGTMKGAGHPEKYLPSKFLRILDIVGPALGAGILSSTLPLFLNKGLSNYRTWVIFAVALLTTTSLFATAAFSYRYLKRKAGGVLDEEFGIFSVSEFNKRETRGRP